MKPLIAIVGRANVGKSSLFNRLAGKPLAIVEDLPGTTRDRVFAETTINDIPVILVDTGGLEMRPDTTLAEKVHEQAEMAIREADVIIFVTDARSGLIPADMEIADLLRRSPKPVFLVVNKVDHPKLEANLADFYKLGLTPIAVSAHQGRGTDDLADSIARELPEVAENDIDPKQVKLAIVGRPNVGKSTLLNAFLGEERAVVDQEPGTTRDALDTYMTFKKQELVLIDTAGVRRRGRIDAGIEYYSVLRTLRAIDRCDVAFLVLDAGEGITAQDLHMVGYIKDAFKGVIVVVNKWDKIGEEWREEFYRLVAERFKFIPYAPVFYVSAKYNKGLAKLLPTALSIAAERQKEIEEEALTELMKAAIKSQGTLRKGEKVLEIKRAYQSKTNPPTFVLVVNDPELIHFSYQRYLENQIRYTFGFAGSPLSLVFKKSGKKAKIAKTTR